MALEIVILLLIMTMVEKKCRFNKRRRLRKYIFVQTYRPMSNRDQGLLVRNYKTLFDTMNGLRKSTARERKELGKFQSSEMDKLGSSISFDLQSEILYLFKNFHAHPHGAAVQQERGQIEDTLVLLRC